MRKRFRGVMRRTKLIEGVGQVAGAGSVVYGVWQVWEPLGFIVAGAALMLVSFGLSGEK